MSDSAKHFVVGAGVGAAIYLLACSVMRRSPTWLGLLGCAAGGGMVALAPDALEPTMSPNHRRFFHSVTVLVALGYADYRILTTTSLTQEEILGLLAATSGYASHLFLDAFTPKSLPAI